MSESANEKYERLAQKFLRETGMMAPGKSELAAGVHTPYDERMEAWKRWRSENEPLSEATLPDEETEDNGA